MPADHRLSSAADAPAGRAVPARVLWVVAIGTLLVPLNSTMIAVALPSIIDDFDSSIGTVSLLVTAYLVAMAVLQPLGGQLGDRVGRRPLVIWGLVWFAVASALAATASTLGLLILWRVQQAIAGAIMFPNAIAILREIVPSDRLGGRIGTVTAALPLGAAAGPPVGGLLIAVASWEWVFLVNLPIIAVVAPLAWAYLPRAEPRTEGPDGGGLRAAAAVLRRAHFLAAAGAVALLNMAMYVTVLAVPILLAVRPGFDHAASGIALGGMFLAAFAMSPVGGRLADRWGRRSPAVAGIAVEAAGIVVLALAAPTIGFAALVAVLVAIGAGIGIAGPPVQVAALEAAAVRSAGVASGVYSTSRYVGSIIGTALFAGPLAPGPGTRGFSAAFAAMAVAAAGAAALAATLPGRRGPVPAPARREVAVEGPRAAEPTPE